MKCPAEYWVWLQRTLGAGKRLDEFLSYFGDPVTLYEAGHAEWVNSGVFNERDSKKLVQFSPSQSYSIMKQCQDNGWDIITYDDDCYPARLRTISDPPCVLYVRGDKSILNSAVSVGMVGTRDSSDYGLNVARQLAESLARSGVVIVSGGALGVDSAAHEGAINASGKTVAVLGCGLGSKYLIANENLRDDIAQNGAVISEFLPFSDPSRTTFPVRNRIISGMTLGTVVVEAGERSGSLITARLALEQGRDVFAVPGDVTNSNYFGTNNLIRDGAKSVFSHMDILDSYIEAYGEYIDTDKRYTPVKASVPKEKPRISQVSWNSVKAEISKPKKDTEKRKPVQDVRKEEKIERKLPEYATEDAGKIYSLLSEKGILADDLVTESGLNVSQVLSALTELEMYGCAYMGSGKLYYLK